MKVEVISSEIIKPYSPTPDHLLRYQLSFLDQISPRAYSPFIYFYALNDCVEPPNIADISGTLKKSLSQALTLYYPLAGRFTNEDFVNCNDEGALYLEARVLKTRLSEVLKNPVPSQLNDLLPFQLDQLTELPLGVQLNIFEGGGIAIGVSISHRLADALSCLVFIRSWMAMARGEEDKVVPPEFNLAVIFPPKNMGGYDPSFEIIQKSNTIVTKRFVFDGPKIEALRAKYDESENIDSPKRRRRLSRIEALSAFIWNRFVAATRADLEPAFNNVRVIHHAVNLRPKFDPPLPEHSFGNLYSSSTTTPPSFITSADRYELARKVGEDIRKVDKEFVENLRHVGDEFLAALKKGTKLFVRGEMVSLVFTSLCSFPLYEADFGLGKPTWVSSAARCFKNVVGLLDNKTGDGIEAYICLKPEHMAKFEVDHEFLSFVTPINYVAES